MNGAFEAMDRKFLENEAAELVNAWNSFVLVHEKAPTFANDCWYGREACLVFTVNAVLNDERAAGKFSCNYILETDACLIARQVFLVMKQNLDVSNNM